MVPKVYAAAMLVTAVVFWLFSHHDRTHAAAGKISVRDQLEALRDPRVWKYCQYYSIVFGGYVALSLWMTKYYIVEYGFDIRLAALLAACFSLPGGVLRAFGGWLSDRFGAHPVTWWVMLISWVCLFFMSYPQTQLTIKTMEGDLTMSIGLNWWMFTLLLFVMGVAWAFGKASVFKYISDEYPSNIGVISGIVGLMGGLGGFVLPIMFGALVDFTGVNSSVFMLLWGITFVSLIWMYWTEIVPKRNGSRAVAGFATAALEGGKK
jgi:NNP family nitrate/nitrite transporter-like MFS transporter